MISVWLLEIIQNKGARQTDIGGRPPCCADITPDKKKIKKGNTILGCSYHVNKQIER